MTATCGHIATLSQIFYIILIAENDFDHVLRFINVAALLITMIKKLFNGNFSTRLAKKQKHVPRKEVTIYTYYTQT